MLSTCLDEKLLPAEIPDGAQGLCHVSNGLAEKAEARMNRYVQGVRRHLKVPVFLSSKSSGF